MIRRIPIKIEIQFVCFSAAGYGHNDLITFLIDKGAQVDARDSKNMTPFLLASSKPKAKPSTIQLLLEAGADVNASEAFMKNCIHLAVESENHELIQLFLGNEKAVLNLYSPDVSERVALHYAAKSGSLKVRTQFIIIVKCLKIFKLSCYNLRLLQ